MRPFLRRGERELLALAFAHRGRCHLLKQDYRQVIDDTKRFIRLYEMLIDEGNLAAMHEHEKKVLSTHEPGATFIGNMPLLSAACEIANQCRERVGNGFAPKVVLEHSRKAIEGLEPLDFMVFPGLNALRAHLHVTRAHAALELERWEEAKEDAEMALACDPSFKEAEYMKQSAENEEW
uniref:KIF-binding protein n=1 Tax=Alexandrium andersonii TaxID=327968 RepID=A0A7S2BPS8_9DINO